MHGGGRLPAGGRVTVGNGEDSCGLAVFARAPVRGQVKTRLLQSQDAETARALGRLLRDDEVLLLYEAFVEDALAKGAQVGFSRRALYVAGDQTHPVLARLAERFGYVVQSQGEGDLGQRMERALRAEDSGQGVVLIGTDSPTLPVALLQAARQGLSTTADLVLGPACDGGYYLVGTRQAVPEVFAAGIPWGTSAVLTQTLERLALVQARGLAVRLLPFFYDCDTAQDVVLLRAHLRMGQVDGLAAAAPATWNALRELGIV